MTRRPGNPARRYGASPTRGGSSYLPIAFIFAVGILFILYLRSGRGNVPRIGRLGGDFPCTAEVQESIPFLKKAYGDAMRSVLHVGPDTCSVVSLLSTQDSESEAWGIDPFDVEESDVQCRRMVRKGVVRVADIKFPLPYRAKSFSLVLVSDALDYLSPKYLNQTLPDLARLSKQGLAIFTGYPHRHKEKGSEASKTGRSAKLRSSSWWARYFIQTSLEENESVTGKFEKAIGTASYKPSCQIFHLKSYD